MQAIIPHMRKARSGHIINVSSIGGIIGQPINDAYCASKFAVEGLSEASAACLACFNVKVTLINPGPVATNFVETATGNSQGELLWCHVATAVTCRHHAQVQKASMVACSSVPFVCFVCLTVHCFEKHAVKGKEYTAPEHDTLSGTPELYWQGSHTCGCTAWLQSCCQHHRTALIRPSSKHTKSTWMMRFLIPRGCSLPMNVPPSSKV